jgi:hypothetical protein
MKDSEATLVKMNRYIQDSDHQVEDSEQDLPQESVIGETLNKIFLNNLTIKAEM